MRVLEVGCGLHYGLAESGRFKSTQSFLDFDFVIWNPGKTRQEYFTTGSYYFSDGVSSLKPTAANALKGDVMRRAAEVTDMMELGRTLIVWTPDPQACEIKVYQGGSRTQYEVVDLLRILPFHTRTGAMSGSSIELRGGQLFKPFWAQNQNSLRYEGQMLSPQGKPVFFVKGTDKIVGTHLKINRGNILFLPSLVESTTAQEQEQAEYSYISSLTQLVEELQKTPTNIELPAWSSSYLLPQESEHVQNLRELEDKLRRTQSSINAQRKRIEELEQYKLLFTGSGQALEQQVRRVFEELGFSVGDPPPNRDDLIISRGDEVAVVEVKGVSKSAAEKHAAQLEKWVNEYNVAHDVHPKGILVVNAYRDDPPEGRSEEAFPNQMLSFSKNRGHCLITTLQLLGLYLDCKNDDVKKAEMVNRLLSTEGVFTEYQNWSDFLTKT